LVGDERDELPLPDFGSVLCDAPSESAGLSSETSSELLEGPDLAAASEVDVDVVVTPRGEDFDTIEIKVVDVVGVVNVVADVADRNGFFERVTVPAPRGASWDAGVIGTSLP
jgi:hypothetical protein